MRVVRVECWCGDKMFADWIAAGEVPRCGETIEAIAHRPVGDGPSRQYRVQTVVWKAYASADGHPSFHQLGTVRVECEALTPPPFDTYDTGF